MEEECGDKDSFNVRPTSLELANSRAEIGNWKNHSPPFSPETSGNEARQYVPRWAKRFPLENTNVTENKWQIDRFKGNYSNQLYVLIIYI